MDQEEEDDEDVFSHVNGFYFGKHAATAANGGVGAAYFPCQACAHAPPAAPRATPAPPAPPPRTRPHRLHHRHPAHDADQPRAPPRTRPPRALARRLDSVWEWAETIGLKKCVNSLALIVSVIDVRRKKKGGRCSYP